MARITSPQTPWLIAPLQCTSHSYHHHFKRIVLSKSYDIEANPYGKLQYFKGISRHFLNVITGIYTFDVDSKPQVHAVALLNGTDIG